MSLVPRCWNCCELVTRCCCEADKTKIPLKPLSKEEAAAADAVAERFKARGGFWL